MSEKKVVVLGVIILVMLMCVLSILRDSKAYDEQSTAFLKTYGVTMTPKSNEIELSLPAATQTVRVTPTGYVTPTTQVAATMVATATPMPTDMPTSEELIPWDQMLYHGNGYIFCETDSQCIPGLVLSAERREIIYTGWDKDNRRQNGATYSFLNLEGGYQEIPLRELKMGTTYLVCQGNGNWPMFFDHGKDASEFVFRANDCISATLAFPVGDGEIVWTEWLFNNYSYAVRHLKVAYTDPLNK